MNGEGRFARVHKLDPRGFYEAIGRALTAWSSAEDRLCDVFCRCLRTAKAAPTHRAFWAVVSFEAKLKMVDVAMCDRFESHPVIGPEWKEIEDLLRKGNRQRNKIAHGAVAVIEYLNKQTKKYEDELVFGPYLHATIGQTANAPKDLRPTNRMSVPQLQKEAEKFHALKDRVAELAKTVARERFPKARASRRAKTR